MEPDLTRQFLSLGYRADVDGATLLSPDGREAYQISFAARGARDLRDAAVRLATSLARHPDVEHGYVLTALVRISGRRVRAEWDLIGRVLLPGLAAKMHLLAVVDGTEVSEPADARRTPVLDRFLTLVKQRPLSPDSRSSFSEDHNLPVASRPGLSWKHLEVEKVLLYRWLLDTGPIAIGTLSKQVGCSYPTTIQAIRRLSADGLIERTRGRSVALSRYPRDRWADLLREQRLVYPPYEFVDPTAAPSEADEIMRRLNRLRPEGAAIGGVVAARQWDPSFNLNGTPRIDVLLHTLVTRAPLDTGRARDTAEFVRRLDPALRRRSPQMRGAPVLVIHHTYRQEPLFLHQPPSPIPLADPVEIVCHLNELGLTAQAGELVRHLRRDVKP